MDLMTLAAKLVLDDSSFRSGLDNAEGLGQKFTGKLSAMTVAAGQFMYDAAKKAVDAITGMVSGAVGAYADYQQLIGGVETLFKGSADKVSNYAKQSFKTTGLSANQYMETVTSFSASLLQGLKGDTEAAAELANTAITDMADNANKMGTDISAIQTAYQGFAKQNYTMLDNLKLGYGGTAQEMVRLVNDSGILDHEIKNLDGITFDQLVAAIHEIQTQMGITGTTAKEAASTISGSEGSLKAAWEDLLSAVAGNGEGLDLDTSLTNFKTSFQTYMDNYIPALEGTIANIGKLVEGVGTAVSNLPTDLISNLASAGLTAGVGIVNGADNIVSWLIDSIVQMLQDFQIDDSKVAAFGTALGNFLGNTVGKLIVNFPAIATGMVKVGITLAGSILQGIWDGLFGNETNSKLKEIENELTSTITDAEVSSGKAQSILKYMDDLHKEYGAAVTETDAWKAAEEKLEGVLGGSSKVFADYGKDIDGAITKLTGMADEQAEASAKAQAILTYMSQLHKQYGDAVTETKEWQDAEKELETVLGGSKETFDNYGEDIDGAIDYLQDMAKEQGEAAKTARDTLKEMDDLHDEYGAAVKETDEWKRAEGELEDVLGGSSEVFEKYGKDVQGALDVLKAMNDELKRTAIINAMQKAVSDQYAFLAEQTLEYEKQKYIADSRAGMMDTARQNTIDFITGNAAEAAERYKKEATAFGDFDESYYNQLAALAEGRLIDIFGEEFGTLSDQSFEELKNLALEVSADTELAKAQIEANKQMYAEAEQEKNAAQTRMTELQAGIDATKEAIQNTEAAMDAAVIDLLGSGQSAATGIESAGASLSSALNSVAAGIYLGRPHKNADYGFAVGEDIEDFMPRAVGINYTPNGFRAQLHQGEAILTKEENEALRSGVAYGNMEAALEYAIEQGMSKMYINMSGEKVADITSRRTGRNLSTSERSVVRAMGG